MLYFLCLSFLMPFCNITMIIKALITSTTTCIVIYCHGCSCFDKTMYSPSQIDNNSARVISSILEGGSRILALLSVDIPINSIQ